MLLTNRDLGISPADWSRAKGQARAAITSRATAGRTINYTELVSQITAVRFRPNDVRLDHLLGEIASEEDAAGRGMLTVVVVHKSGDKRPGPGFFELAEHLGRDTSDHDALWFSELRRVYAVWDRI